MRSDEVGRSSTRLCADRYVKSRSDTQLRNEKSGGGLLDSLGVGGSNDMKDCEPQRTRTLPNGTKLVRRCCYVPYASAEKSRTVVVTILLVHESSCTMQPCPMR